jgi:hypothetical protein
VGVEFQTFLTVLNVSDLLDSRLGSITQKPVFEHDTRIFSVYLTTMFLIHSLYFVKIMTGNYKLEVTWKKSWLSI